MKKSNLDEMQEQKLLTIERNGYWTTFWGLLAAIAVQVLLSADFRQIIGEILIFMVGSAYIMISCLRHGIWDRNLKPDRKTNLLGSLAAGIFIGIFSFINISAKTDDIKMSLLFAVVFSVVVFVLCFTTLTLCTKLYQSKRDKLDQE